MFGGKKIQNNLSSEMLRSIVDSIEMSINVFDKKGKRIFVNPYYYHLSGKSEKTDLAPDMTTGENKKKGEYLTKKLMQSIKTGKVFEVHNFFYKAPSKQTKRYFDFVIGPLKNSRNEIIGGYTTVKDVTTRFLARRNLMRLNNALEKKVAERTEKLEKVSKEKGAFVSNVAHDLKTILTIIRGNLEMLNLQEKIRDPLEMECKKEIEKEIEKMNKISSDLVFIVNSEKYAAEIFKFEKTNLSALLGKIIKKYKVITGGKMKITNSFKASASVYIMADKDKIVSLICNLIENAIKFRSKNAQLKITLSKRKSEAKLVFADNGVGVDKEKIPFVFSPFFQADKTSNHENSGFGLGLTICKKIVDAHRGKILIKSDGRGKGTTIIVWLPIKK